jgi:hypothetical protein
MNENLKLLGCKVVDKVTGFAGVVTSISFDLYGCIQALVLPPFKEKDDRWVDARWFDCNRLSVMDSIPVMDVPDFAKVPGGQDLPDYPSQP